MDLAFVAEIKLDWIFKLLVRNLDLDFQIAGQKSMFSMGIELSSITPQASALSIKPLGSATFTLLIMDDIQL